MAGDTFSRPHVSPHMRSFALVARAVPAVRAFRSGCPGPSRCLAAALALLWLAAAQPAWAASGYWIITGHQSGPVAAMDAAQAEAFTGKRLFLDNETIAFESASCAIVPTLADHDAATYFADTFRITPQSLGHKAPKVFVIETGCDIPGLSSLILLDDGRMCFSLDGVFFFLSEELE